ncbi:hypothetical protein BcepSauron_107 [Burkholderia phage BcepSauron]|uniref:Uncharacterized protein n=1 Tax=Burkholderia phage BcepSauron TaxID=2530033 RepID=A0A482MKD9_9CAUD|nr:hypothetical protein H1O17_gp107 [Burkholderia phage BcepSauron]QBQ74487.1 hypothetical protein BcepSauron_107 [Burkholderia phage BcepSauron]
MSTKKAPARKFAGVNAENIKFTQVVREPEALSQKGYGTVFSQRLDNGPEDLYMLIDTNGNVETDGMSELFGVRLINGMLIGFPYATLVYERRVDFNVAN